MRKFYCYLLIVMMLSLLTGGCASSSHRSEVGVLKTETRTNVGKYKGDD